MVEKYIDEEVWECTLKYIRMMRVTKEKYFESLLEGKSVKEYAKELHDLWTMDHRFMDKAIEELNQMVAEIDIKDYEEYAITTQKSVKVDDGKLYYENVDKLYYPLNPEEEFKKIENKYVDNHIKSYKRQSKLINKVADKNEFLSKLVPKYDKLDKTIPYYNHDGSLKCYNTIATYNSMLYNVNLTRSAWNRTNYDAEILGNDLQYLVAHPYACPKCMFYQGKVYTTNPNDKRYPQKEEAIEGGVGHPNCKHTWTLFWSTEQIQRDKYNSSEWAEKYKTEQKIRSLDLEKSRLLSDRRIYKNLEQQDKVDECSSNIRDIRAKIKELKDQA